MHEQLNETTEAKWYRWVLLLMVLCVGVYVTFLQQVLYQHKAPFFDSVSYFDRVYDVISIRRQEGLLAAIENAVFFDSTICFPYLLAIACSYLTEPVRSIGVWIEMFYLAVFVFSFAEYLRLTQKCSAKQIVFCLAPVLMLNALYRSTAGLSDLRVDLPFAFLYGATACWWLIGRRTSQWRHFVLAGVCAGIACLSRATAPIFLTCGFLPLFLFEWLAGNRAWKPIVRASVVVGTATFLSAWFYVIQFNYIYYYYAVWNTDANALVSWGRAFKHFLAAFKSLGFVLLAFFVTLLWWHRRIQKGSRIQTRIDSGDVFRQRKAGADLAFMLWLGFAPILLLVAKRADINPFVSLPGVVLLLMAGIVYDSPKWFAVQACHPRAFLGMMMAFVLLAWSLGYLNHARPATNTMAGHQRLVSLIESDAHLRDRTSVTYAVSAITKTNAYTLESMFQYSRNSRYVNPITAEVDGIIFSAFYESTIPSRADWNQRAGDTEKEKLKLLEAHTNSEVDYLVMISDQSLPFVEAKYANLFSMQFASQIQSMIKQSGDWQQISEPIQMEDGVVVELWRNMNPARNIGTVRTAQPRLRGKADQHLR